MKNNILADLPLVPDPDAGQELGKQHTQAVSDTEIKGCRLLVACSSIEASDFDGVPGGILQLECTFQPTMNVRFSYAQLWLQLEKPESARFVDIAPRLVKDSNPVEFTYSQKGSITLKHASIPIEPSFESGSTQKYARYYCLVQGSGAGTKLARWDFRENPERRDGIGPEQTLSFTLSATGAISGNMMVSARVARSGLQGTVDHFRDLILGGSMTDKAYPFRLVIPGEWKPS